jgi:NAD(P)-dependent dehydrogenase (short-subunit alcohol dehydrogenase family)
MNKIAVVTGAGSGVGRAVTLELARRGYSVALLGRREELLNETISLAGKTSSKLVKIVCDVAREDDVSAMATRVRTELGDPTVLVNSAGVNVPRRALADISVADYEHVIDVNLTGAFLCIQAFLPGMRKLGSGTIVNVISDAGLYANSFSGVAYIASKFGMAGLTDAINVEERKNGIRACGIYPGEINTPLLDKRPVPPPQEAREKMLQVEDVAAAVTLAIDLPDRAVVERLLIRPRTK